MTAGKLLIIAFLALALAISMITEPAPACCPAPPEGKPVVNSDQSVIIVWDAATKTEHFIRQASFKSDAEDFGFLVPSPSQPELNESGNYAFHYLSELTKPEVETRTRWTHISCGCAS